jgi:hypothetical protein
MGRGGLSISNGVGRTDTNKLDELLPGKLVIEQDP